MPNVYLRDRAGEQIEGGWIYQIPALVGTDARHWGRHMMRNSRINAHITDLPPRRNCNDMGVCLTAMNEPHADTNTANQEEAAQKGYSIRRSCKELFTYCQLDNTRRCLKVWRIDAMRTRSARKKRTT